jgi:glycogen debranching enzyme
MTEEGVLASSADEVYGAVFGRDSLITALFLMEVYEEEPDPELLGWMRTIVERLVAEQGVRVVPQSGEEPGKCIHEWRPEGHEHLTRDQDPPWFLYPDGVMRNFEGADETPLLAWTIGRYVSVVGWEPVPREFIRAAERALAWMHQGGDTDGDGLIDFSPHADPATGGLTSQTWMDSSEALFHEVDAPLTYPVEMIEVQGYAYAALQLWSELLAAVDPAGARQYGERAALVKTRFAEVFIGEHGLRGCGVDGAGKIIAAVRSNMGHLLWASVGPQYAPQCILPESVVPAVAARLMEADLFTPHGGIRTLSTHSPHFTQREYQNGTVWPHDSLISASGLARWEYHDTARQVREAVAHAIAELGTPIEFYAVDPKTVAVTPGFEEAGGHHACRVQAWCAAGLLSQMPLAARVKNLSQI